MIRKLQTVGWSLLNPEPVEFEPAVVCLMGQNGSGKTSTLDALKLLLGSRRFGRDRSVAAYRFAGRAGYPAAKSAYVLAVIDNHGVAGARLQGKADKLTVICEVGASRRRFLMLEGEQLLDTSRLGEELERLREQYPRARWLTPEDYARKLLDPLGVGPALRRLLELPQGEVQRALDRDPKELVSLLLELSGGRDASERFLAAQAAVDEARASHAEVQRRIDRRRAELAEAKFAAAEAQHVRDLRLRLGVLAGAGEKIISEFDNVEQEPARRPLAINRAALAARGIDLLVQDGYLVVREQDKDAAEELLGPGELLPVENAGLDFLRGRGLVACGPPIQDDETVSEPLAAAADVNRLKRALAELRSAGIEPLGGDEEQWDAASLAGAIRGLCLAGVPREPRTATLDELQAQETLLGIDQNDLAERRELLVRAQSQLEEARAAYEQAVIKALHTVGERFSEITADAGLAGRLEVVERGGEVQVEIWAAENPGEQLRPLHGAQASLSGGWRATVVVLAVLACLEAESAAPVLLLDEVGSSLDEQRLSELGKAFARLAAKRGLQTIITLPTRSQSDAVADFTMQQIGFMRPLPSEALAPPPHIVAAPDRQVA